MWCSLCQLALLHLIMCLCTCLCTSTFFPSLILVPCMIHNHLCLCSESIHFQHLKSWSFCEQSVYITIKRWPNWHRDCVETCTSLLDSHVVRHLIGKIGITSEVITESKLFYLDRFKMFSIKAKESSFDFGRDFMMKKWLTVFWWDGWFFMLAFWRHEWIYKLIFQANVWISTFWFSRVVRISMFHITSAWWYYQYSHNR